MLRMPDGSFSKVSYEKALDIIVSHLDRLRHDKRQKSVLYYTGSGMAGLTNEIGFNFFKAFGGATTTYGNFCWPAGLEAVRLTLGEVKQNAPWELENADLIIIWGKNPAETNIQETVFIDNARQKGAEIIVIDPRRTATADKASMLVKLRPGTDAALALAIARIIVRSGRTNEGFIRDYVSGFDEFSESLDLTPEKAHEICGVPVDTIEHLAEKISAARAVTIIAGFGMQRYTNGGQTVRSIISLLAITGNIGRPGAGFNYANLQGYIFDRIKEPQSYYPEIGADPLFRRTVSMARLGEDLGNITNPELEFAWIERGNPITQAPDTNLVIESLRKIKFKLVIDQFMTDTAMHADLIMPAKNMFEQQDIVSSYWSPYVAYRARVLDPPPGVKPESVLFYDLATRLNLHFDKNDIPAPGDAELDQWLTDRIDGMSQLSLDDLKKAKVLAPGLQEIAYSDMIFATESGKIELVSKAASSLWSVSVLPGYDPAFKSENSDVHKFVFMSPNTKNRIHSQFGNLQSIKIHEPEPKLQLNNFDAKELGIRQGDKVRVYNDRGTILLKADVTGTISRGAVALPNGWWLQEGGGGNLLSAGRETDMGYGTAFHDNLVTVERVENG